MDTGLNVPKDLDGNVLSVTPRSVGRPPTRSRRRKGGSSEGSTQRRKKKKRFGKVDRVSVPPEIQCES